jgi:hypothetical protein
MGQMRIQVEGEPRGSTTIHVEEYKRPNFLVTLDHPKTAPRLDNKVLLPGKAAAYTGSAINGAKVRWRVVREVRYPPWCFWFSRYAPQRESQEIAHGTATTAADGGFSIEFVARPDLSVPEKEEPTFQFTVSADVTDTNGETRSGEQSVHAGYMALKASLAAEEWQTDQKPVEVTITTQTLDNQPLAAEGVLKIYHLRQPEKVVRQSYFPTEPAPLPRRGVGGNKPLPPPKPDLSDLNSWELGAQAAEEKFQTAATGTVKKNLQTGARALSSRAGNQGPVR